MTTNTSTIRVMALFSLIATLGPLAARAEGPLYFSIPFGFTVGSKALNPGDYLVSTVTPGVLEIRSEKAHAAVIIMTQTGEPLKHSKAPTLTFRRYGDQYFLSRMADPSQGWELPKSRGERELIAHRASPKPFAVMASARK